MVLHTVNIYIFFLALLGVVSLRQIKYNAKCAFIKDLNNSFKSTAKSNPRKIVKYSISVKYRTHLIHDTLTVFPPHFTFLLAAISVSSRRRAENFSLLFFPSLLSLLFHVFCPLQSPELSNSQQIFINVHNNSVIFIGWEDVSCREKKSLMSPSPVSDNCDVAFLSENNDQAR